MDGILLVDKPPGITSFGVVDRLKKKFGLVKVGHGGTLDPMATGLLVVLVGRATKIASRFLKGDKEYDALVLLGRVTDTQDLTGKVLRKSDEVRVTREEIEKALRFFRGEIEQIPPMTSALKYRGRRLYRLAREGREVPRPPRKVVIRKLKINEFSPPYLRLFIRCSRGTYIRTLSHELGKKLGTGACLAALRRKVSGPFRLEEATTLSGILNGSRRDLESRLLAAPGIRSSGLPGKR